MDPDHSSQPTSRSVPARSGFQVASRETLGILGCVTALIFGTDFALASDQIEPTLPSSERALIEEHCTSCHNHKRAKGKINLEQLIESKAWDAQFKTWELVRDVLEAKEMPPEDEPQPSDEARTGLIQVIEQELKASARAAAGDPGPVVLRRLTSAEYNYAIQDLTGLNLNLDRVIGADAVGGEGFTNVGEVQFIQDATIERYLEAAKTVAAHALIGAGPLSFAPNPGKSGQELSAIDRILKIYRDHGFRTGAGEGAEAFGLEQYPKAFFAAWNFKHREALNETKLSLADIAQREGLKLRFVEHIWNTLTDPNPLFPVNQIAQAWDALPTPTLNGTTDLDAIRSACDRLYAQLNTWQTGLAANTNDDEEAAVLAGKPFVPQISHRFRVGISWPPGSTEAEIELAVHPTCEEGIEQTIVQWENPRLFIRQSAPGNNRRRTVQLKDLLTEEQRSALNFGTGPNGTTIDPDNFITTGQQTIVFKVSVPPETRGGFLSISATLDLDHGSDCLVRCTISDGLVEGETIASTGASAALLANPDSPNLRSWQKGIAHFAKVLPQVSHREPAPSDRDPIPPPYDNRYNTAERNSFHYVIKYHRDDEFLSEYLIDPSTRKTLDDAWTDLLTSFDYHDTFYHFVTQKYEIEDHDRDISEIDLQWIDAIPSEPGTYIRNLHEGYHAATQSLSAAQDGHLADLLQFTQNAWRRKLSTLEADHILSYYRMLTTEHKLPHDQALRISIARILVSPSFIYRFEKGVKEPLVANASPDELATRLSFFLWSSLPDQELRESATSGILETEEGVQLQLERMLPDPKIRRFATEFFGQWFGFYQFDQFKGVDLERFPQFTSKLSAAMYEEAIAFFEHIVRHDRPIKDLLFADYTFLNSLLASHYEMSPTVAPEDSFVKVDQIKDDHRGGLLQLGAILTATSAPLRTSPVKRGDWILRRVLGTPVPPPPADAGSIPADDILADGLTVRDRLEAHRQDPTCANCHSRIDPLGFALEHFDSVGRWREHYRDGQAIDDAGILSDGSRIQGMNGLHTYLADNGETFLRNLTSKLLGYALGRAELISDQPLIDQISQDLNLDSPFSELVLRIVTSRQFRTKRGLASDTRKFETSATTLDLEL